MHIEAIHNSLNKYKRMKCKTSFGQAGDLRRHITCVHEEKIIYKCEKCDIH